MYSRNRIGESGTALQRSIAQKVPFADFSFSNESQDWKIAVALLSTIIKILLFIEIGRVKEKGKRKGERERNRPLKNNANYPTPLYPSSPWPISFLLRT